MQNQNEITLIRLPRVQEMTGLSRTYIYELQSKGRFPASIKMGAATAWVLSEVITWIKDRIAESRRGAA